MIAKGKTFPLCNTDVNVSDPVRSIFTAQMWRLAHTRSLSTLTGSLNTAKPPLY